MHNPGLSDKAWKNLHALVARIHIKYAKEIAEYSRKKAAG